MSQMLPLLLDWLSVTPDPDLGLLGLRNLALQPHHRSRLVTTFRESPEAARRLCLLVGSSRTLGEAVAHNPELMSSLGDDDALALSGREQLKSELLDRMRLARSAPSRRARLVRFHQEHLVRIATRDLLDMDDVLVTAGALSSLAEAMLEAAIDEVGARGALLYRRTWQVRRRRAFGPRATSMCCSSRVLRRTRRTER